MVRVIPQYPGADDNDTRLQSAILYIESTYGDKVSFGQKKKLLNKFGRTNNADDGVKTTVAIFQDAEVNETFTTTNSIDSVISTSASDTEVVTIEGQTQNLTTGAFTFVTQNATLNGQTAVTLGTALARCDRIYVPAQTYGSPAADLVGDVAVYDSTVATGTTAGKPDVDTSVKCMVQGTAGKNQSEKCATTLSSVDYWIVTEIYASVTRGGPLSAVVDIDVEYRQVGGVWRPLGLELNVDEASAGYLHDEMDPPLVLPKNSDVRMVATSDTADTQIAGYINGWLAIVT